MMYITTYYRYLGLGLAFALLTTFGAGCDLLGSGDDEPAADEVVVVGTQVGNDFQETGEFGLSATPLDKGGSSILSENVNAEVDVAHSDTSTGTASAKSHFEATVSVNHVNEPSDDPLAVTLDFDASGSLAGNDPDEIRKEGGKAFIDELEDIGREYEASVFEYSTDLFSSCIPNPQEPFDCSYMWQDFTNDATALKDSIEQVRASGSTPTYGSLLEVLGYSEAERPKEDYEKAVILFSDGIPNDDNLEARRDSVCNDEIPDKESPVWAIGLGPGNDHPEEDATDPAAVREMNRLASCSDQGGAYIGINPDPDSAEQSIQDRFAGFATASAQGSITFNVEITSGLDEFEAGDTVQGILRVTSGGETVKGSFSFRVPETDKSPKAFHYTSYK